MMLPLLTFAAFASSGTYFEARTCSLMAGPCHYSGELMVDGRTAVMIWKFETGPFAGSKIAAITESDSNLSFRGNRTSRLFVDGASPDQLSRVIQTHAQFGDVVEVVPARINLTDSSATIEGVYEARFTNGPCTACPMPGQLWYSPLDPLVHADVKTVEVQKLIGEWSRRDEAAAFYGRF